MICDLAETYHITDYKSLPASTVAILVAGLRENSRIKMKQSDVKASQETLLLAAVIDRIGLLISTVTGQKLEESVLEQFVGESIKTKKAGQKKDHVVFANPEEFERARYGGE